MGIVKDLTGLRFNHLTVIRQCEGISARKYANWLCQCDCGNTIVTDSGRLRDGQTRDCGCRIGAITMKVPVFCKFNDGVECEKQLFCQKCGWNPTVAQTRKETAKIIRQQRKGRK